MTDDPAETRLVRDTGCTAATLAGRVGVMVSVLVLLAAFLMVASNRSVGGDRFITSASVVGDTLAQEIGDRIGRALRLGIALDRLYGVPQYLDRLAAEHPDVARITVFDQTGRILFSGGTGAAMVSAVVTQVKVPFHDEAEQPMGSVEVVLAPALRIDPFERLIAVLLATALLAGLLAKWAVRVVTQVHLDDKRNRMAEALERIAAKDFSAAPPNADCVDFARLTAAITALLHGVNARFARLLAEAETIRILDVEGGLAVRVDAILAAITARFRFAATVLNVTSPPAHFPKVEADWPIPALIATASLISPFIANFALDRGASHLPPALVASLPAALYAAALLIGLWLARLAPGWVRFHPLAQNRVLPIVLCLALAGICIAGVRWCRDFDSFIQLLTGGGVATGLALGLMIPALPARSSRGEAPSLGPILTAALIVGPLAGGVLGEVLGRRLGFLTAGAVMVGFAWMVAVCWRPSSAAEPAAAPPVPLPIRARLATILDGFAAGIAGGATILVLVPQQVWLRDYFLNSALTMLTGLGVLLALRAPPGRPWYAGTAMAAGLLLIQHWLEPDAHWLAALLPAGFILLGIGLGSRLRHAYGGAADGSGSGAILAGSGLCGMGLGALGVGASELWSLGAGTLPAAVTLVLPLAADIIDRRRTSTSLAAIAQRSGP